MKELKYEIVSEMLTRRHVMVGWGSPSAEHGMTTVC